VTAFPSGNEACASAPSTCISVTPAAVTCTPPGAPTGLANTVSGSTVSLTWTAVSGATEYHILRGTVSGGPYSLVGTSTTASFNDTGLANGTYFYVVRAATSASCESGNSNQTTATVAVTCTPPAAPTLSGSVSGSTVNLSWTTVSGATAYHVLRSTTSGGPYTQIASVTTTTFADTGLANGTYFYVVRAFNACESANSNEVSETVSVTCTNTTLYSNTFETGSGLSDWTKGTFVAGGSTTSWRGIQACSPTTSGTHIFRYGGTTCTSSYGNNNFTFAQPKGATGIAFGAAANTSRLTFKHRYNFESGFDGGTLALSVDGTNYTFVPASAILSGGYNGTISAACPPAGAAGASSWTGSHNTTFTSTTVDLDAACNAATGLTTGCAGKSVFIAFTSITDCSVTFPGWFLDDVTVSDCQ
jgi:hypothetical protein